MSKELEEGLELALDWNKLEKAVEGTKGRRGSGRLYFPLRRIHDPRGEGIHARAGC